MLEYKFRNLVGHSILEEIRRQRIHRVENLLADTDLPMPVIARIAGFSTPQRMAVVFHAQTGFTPTQYRRQTRNKN
jgi:transcriptional regulator GlxA family with amidase domain